jgi:glycosyltransferase involved in cell wall biosynthesis
MARQVDLIFAQDVASVGLPALIAAKLFRKPFFVRVPGDYAWEQSTQRFSVADSIDEFQTNTYAWRIEFLRSIQKLVTTRADQVITPSNYFKTLVTRWGVSKAKIDTVYNGVDLAIKPDPVTKPAPLTVVTAGRLVPWKGFGVLIEMMMELPSWHLVIIGEGPERVKLQALVKELHLESRVQLTGNISRTEVFGWCRAADVFVLNTHFESFSYQVVEAMYAGVPVITTTVGSLPELLIDGREGLLVTPDNTRAIIDGIKSVVTNKTLWQTRTRAAKEKAETFSIERTMDALAALIKKYET